MAKIKILTWLVIILIVIGGVFLFSRNWTSENGKKISGEATDSPTASASPSQDGKGGIYEKVRSSLSAQMTVLSAVDGSSSSGTAFRLIENGKLYHVVEAHLPDPASGIQYEGWLVQASPLEFFSTGPLEKGETGIWILEYSADETYPTYNKVVITEETKIDDNPEKHILEGTF